MLSRGSTAGNGFWVVKPGGRPAAIGLYQSVMLVLCLMRQNLPQEVAGAVFGVSQSTVGRRWDLLSAACTAGIIRGSTGSTGLIGLTGSTGLIGLTGSTDHPSG
ncbi:transposase family protein [Embleya sp. NBC_00896]|uniref:transposase family protein n=1 Tax=Embleya sp. NBC_00896 TaxID=2975961 RepID=UPI003862D840|nr:transposase family protein [Embleya sp. NBC_00896]